MTKSKRIAILATLLVLAAGAAGFAWWRINQPAAASAAAARKAEPTRKAAKYVTLDKVIVMLRRGPSDAESHYLAADLVLATTDEKERQVKDHLPMLRSVAVRTLSAYAMPVAATMTVEQYGDVLNKSFDASYASQRLEKPFTEVMIGKLIIE